MHVTSCLITAVSLKSSMRAVPKLQQEADGSLDKCTCGRLDLTSLGNPGSQVHGNYTAVKFQVFWASLEEKIWAAVWLLLQVPSYFSQLYIWPQSILSSCTNIIFRHGRSNPGLFPDFSSQSDVWLHGSQSIPKFCRGDALSSCVKVSL